VTDDELSRIARRYRTFAEVEAAEASPLYAELAHAVAADEGMLRFLAGLPNPKRQPNLLFGAVQYLYGTPTGPAQLRAWVARDPEQVDSVLRTRATQTNEAARCAALVPLLSSIEGPLALIEVGASAGLCLYPDRYSYDYDGTAVGAPGPVHLTCTTTGVGPLPGRLPQVGARIGVDLNPLDPADADDRAWLRALVWPGPYAEARLRRLEAACEIARREPALMLTGDLRERLPDALDRVPDGCTPVVFHTAVLAYLDRDERAAFAATVRALPVRWIAQETPGVLPGTGYEPDDESWGEHFVLSLDGRPVARTAPHGGRIEWLDGA
jgi:hypothetical protein